MSAGAIDSRVNPLLGVSKTEAARALARRHYDIEPGMVTVFRLEAPAESDSDPIKLLEVNHDSVATGIMPLGFPPAPKNGIPYSIVIVEITPDELDQLRSGKLRLPEGWQMVEEISNPRGAN